MINQETLFAKNVPLNVKPAQTFISVFLAVLFPEVLNAPVIKHTDVLGVLIWKSIFPLVYLFVMISHGCPFVMSLL
jgi:hypothetical protein